ncbi:MAG: hypothetical protein AB1637_02710 [Elusimicrobiota bacterium]
MKKIIFSFFMIFSASYLFPQDSKNIPEEYKKEILEIDYSNAQIVDHSVYGVMILSLDRWKNWLVRSSIIAMVFATLIILLISMPKDNELNIMIAYSISGAMFSVAFWETLAGWMLTRLSQNFYGFLIISASIIMYAAFYISVLKIKKTDLSFSAIKESFQKMSQISKEDPRLASVSGLPGDWEKEDFVR